MDGADETDGLVDVDGVIAAKPTPPEPVCQEFCELKELWRTLDGRSDEPNKTESRSRWFVETSDYRL